MQLVITEEEEEEKEGVYLPNDGHSSVTHGKSL